MITSGIYRDNDINDDNVSLENSILILMFTLNSVVSNKIHFNRGNLKTINIIVSLES